LDGIGEGPLRVDGWVGGRDGSEDDDGRGGGGGGGREMRESEGDVCGRILIASWVGRFGDSEGRQARK